MEIAVAMIREATACVLEDYDTDVTEEVAVYLETLSQRENLNYYANQEKP